MGSMFHSEATAVSLWTHQGESGDGAGMINHDAIDSLMRRYAAKRLAVERVAEFMADQREAPGGCPLEFFFQGNAGREHVSRVSYRTAELFGLEGAIQSLDASFWQEALALTNIMSLMPARRRREWHESIAALETPPFTEGNLRATLEELLLQRKDFFAERVDGIFRALSREHVTNRPEGFAKRMITFAHYGDFNIGASVAEVDDLRDVVALLLQREQRRHWGTRFFLDHLNRTGQLGEWVPVDGGALHFRLYKRGTLHIEVHPEIAWQLNRVLAHLHPQAIPSQFRAPAKRQRKINIAPLSQPLPVEVLAVLDNLRRETPRLSEGYWVLPVGYPLMSVDAFVRQGVMDALIAMGGQPQEGERVVFDYDPSRAVAHVAFTGCLPDHRSHQFYPTPDELARSAAALLAAGPGDRVLEPSAGTGNLLAHLPAKQTTCIELAELHCQILEAKGAGCVDQADFLAWAPGHERAFDKILMNPPFAAGQAEAHLDAAIACLVPGGRLVAILPSSMESRWSPVQPVTVNWQPRIYNAFPGTSVSVTVAVIDKAGAPA